MATEEARIIVGEFHICVVDGKLWISRAYGEGMSLSDEQAIQALTELWDKWF